MHTDQTCKHFFQNSRRFSSLCNAILFSGEDVIKKDSLIPYQNEETAFIDHKLGIRRLRDIIKKTDIHGHYLLVALENQSDIDRSMPIRTGIYDMLTYYQQFQNQRKLTPVFTIVFYTGERKWKGNHTLRDMMEEIPEVLEHYFNDYRMILVDIKELDATKISDKETREMIQIVQSIYNVERKRPEKIKLTKDAALTAGMITKCKWLIEEAENCKEGVNVCEAMDRYVKRIADEKLLEGERLGTIKGHQLGKIEGKAEEKRDMLITLLTTKLGNLSKQVIEKIKKASSDELKQLTISIFHIESEDDIISIIH